MSEEATDPTNSLLAERGKTHGEFREHARITQGIKQSIGTGGSFQKMNDMQREACAMIAHKLGRIASGDPNYKDHWDDIAGYARLVSDRLPQ